MTGAITSIKIYNPVGSAYYSKADKSSIEFPITDQCERSAKIMGDDYVRLQFKLYDKVTFDAFSYIEYNNQTFFLKEQYIPTPNGTMQENGNVSSAYYTYDVKFVSVANMLDKHICYRHVKVGEQEWHEPEIAINGTLDTMYVIVMGAIKRAADKYSDIVYGHLLNTIYTNGMAADGIKPNYDKVKITANTKLLTFNFSGDNIANVCTTIANNYTNDDKKDTEWYITEEHGASPDMTQLTLHFAKYISDVGLQEFSDYMHKDSGAYAYAHPYLSGGLKKVEYAQAWSGITQTIIPYGSDRNMSGQSVKGIDTITNLQSTFGKRLRLDVLDENGDPKTYKVIDKEGKEQIITINAHGGIDNNLVNTGIEQVKFFDDVYPQGHFKVTEVTTKNKKQDGQIVPEYTIKAVAIDSAGEETIAAEGFFPISIEEGTTLSVRFESGLLNGREFEIANKTRKDEGATTYSLMFTIVADGSIEDGTLIPSGNFIPHLEDKFALFNMKMPDVYVEQAKQELAQKAYEELEKIQTTRPEVKCTTDPTKFNGDIAFGNVVKVSSELFNSEGYEFVSRVISYSYKLTKTTDVQFSLASAVMQGTLSQMNDLISDVTHQAGGLEQRAINLSRRAWRDASEMAEMLDSLQSEMMLVGKEKYQFAFSSGVECKNGTRTTNGETTNGFVGLEIGYGSLQHTQEPYISWTNGGFWEVGSQVLDKDEVGAELDPLTPYYLYAKVSPDNIEMVLNANAYSSEIGTDDAYLLLGILSSEYENHRVFNRTNGFTQVVGGTITTEQIQDAGRNLIIDFQTAEIIARGKAKIKGNVEFELKKEHIDNIMNEIGEIGGENLFRGRNWADWGSYESYKGESWIDNKLRSDNLQVGDYVLTGKAYSTSGGVMAALYDEEGNMLKIIVSSLTSHLDENSTQDNIITTNVGVDLFRKFTVETPCYLAIVPFRQTNVGANYKMYLTNVMLQRGNKATSYQPYVEHLTSALKGTTDIAGGLVMTKALMLKDENNVVTAGMSGIEDDNILVFGGGTYKEAVNAAKADNDFHVGENKTGRQITSLIKKDGTGKIGIFKIDEDKVRVVTSNGVVEIDDDEGVKLIDSKGNVKAALVTESVSNYKPKDDEVVIQQSITFNSDDYEYDYFEIGSSGTCTTNIFKKFDLKSLFGAVTTPFYAKYNIRIYGRLTQGLTNTTYQNTGGVNMQFSLNDTKLHSPVNDGIYQNTLGYAQNGVPPNAYYMEVSRYSNNPLVNYTSGVAYLTPNPTFELKLDVSSTNWCLLKLTGNFTVELTVTRLHSYGYTPKTIVGSDGVLSAFDNTKYFMVQNTSEGQKIYARGLSDGTDRTEGSGELYVTSSFVDAFVSFLDEFNTYVEGVRTIGINVNNATAMQTKIKAIKNSLVDSSGNRITDIIASS